MPNRKKIDVIISRLKALLSIVENFNRSDISVLTTAGNTSAKWQSVRGSWGIVSNKASTSNAATDYPLSTLLFTKEDVTLSLDNIGPGAGTAFWVTDSGNWWGAYIDGVQTCQTCGGNFYAGYGCTNPGSGGNTNPSSGGNTNSRVCNSTYGTICYGYSGPNTNPVVPGNVNPVVPGNTNPYTPGSPGCYYSGYNATYSCNCVTNTSISIIKSIANVISSITNFAFNSTIVGFKTILSGNNLTIKAYSSTGYNSQIGSDQSTTLSNYIKTKKHGIILAPTTYTPAQTSVIDQFEVS